MKKDVVCDPRDIALKSTFLGPQSENGDWTRALIDQVLANWFAWRKSLFPEDGPAISEEDQRCTEFQERKTAFETNLLELQRRFETEIPKFSPRYVGHMFSETSLPALLGNFVTLLHNPNNISGESSLVGIKIEDEALAALATMLGWSSQDSAGHFTSGGTLANFEALVRARARVASWLATGALARERGHEEAPKSVFEAAHLGWRRTDGLLTRAAGESARKYHFVDSDPWRAGAEISRVFGKPFAGPVMLVPNNKHYSWVKGASLLGIGEESLWPIELDEKGKLSLADLERKLVQAEREQRPVMLVVSVVGTTELGHFDPTDRVQDLLDRWQKDKGVQIWHHVDAAYGGFFCSMSETQRELLGEPASSALRAITRADSVTLDPHKLGYAPYSSGAFLTRLKRDYYIKSFTAPYVRFEQSVDRGPYTLEGSRAATGAAATWMISKTVGLHGEGYGRILSRSVLARQSLGKALLKSGLDLRIDPSAESNIICFAQVHGSDTDETVNARMEKLYEAMGPNGRGDFYISKTHLKTSAYGAFLGRFLAGWKGAPSTGGITLARVCLMNPFFNSVQTRIAYEEEFVKTLRARLGS